MRFEVGDLFAYQDEYYFRRGLARYGLVLNIMGRIHHDIDDVCLTVMVGGKVTEEWASFLVKLQCL
jgi:hypothetical protein